jgi:hypothetical protein
VARLAISKDFLTEYGKLDKHVQRTVDRAVASFARHPHPGQHLETPRRAHDDRLRILPLDGHWRGIVLAPATGDTYCLVTVLPQDEADAYVTSLHPSGERPHLVSGPDELQRILAHPFATWRTFLHPSQRQLAYHPRYVGPAQVTGGPGTGKTVTVLHRAAFLAERAAPVLVTTFAGNLAEALQAQLDLLIHDRRVRQNIEVLNVDRLAYRIVKQARGAPVIADERALRTRWAKAAANHGLTFTPAFLKNEWEQVILAQDLHTEQAYLACARTGRGRPLTKAQRSLLWQATHQVTAELKATGQTTHLQLANEATRLLRLSGTLPYRHILVDEAQDLHPSQWRLLRAAVAPGPDDLFIAADPHQRVYDNRVSLTSLGISVRGRSRRLSLNYRTTQEILAWAVPLLGSEPVTGLDGEVDSLAGYRSPTHGPRPQHKLTVSRAEEFRFLAERVGSWLSDGIEPHAVGVAARSAALVREAREALRAAGIVTVSLNGRGGTRAVRAGTMHAMKGLEFQAVAVIGVEQGLVPAPGTVTPETEDAATHAQDLQRERCVLFVACTRARDHLYVSGTGQPSIFLPLREPAAPPPPPPTADIPAFDLGKFFRLLLSRRRLDPGLDAESFLTWATAPGRPRRLAELDLPARQFLTEGADSVPDLVDRCLDLLDRLTGPKPDLDGICLPERFLDAARKAVAGQRLGQPAPRRTRTTAPGRPPRPRIGLDPRGAGLRVILPLASEVATWQLTADGDPVTVRSRAQAMHPLPRPVRTVHVSLAGRDHVTDLEVVPSPDPILFFSEDGQWLPARFPLPAENLWILRPADRELTTAGELRAIAEGPLPPGWAGWHLQLASLETVSSVTLEGGPVHAVRRYPRPRLMPGQPPQLWLPDASRWHVGIRPAAGGSTLVSREFDQAGPVGVWDGMPRPIHGAFDITVRGPLGRWLRQTICVAEGPDVGPLLLTPPQPRPRQLAGGVEVSSGRLIIRDPVQAGGLAAALYLTRAPWRAPVVVPVPADGVVRLPTGLYEAGPLRVLLGAEAPGTAVNWPDWPARDSYACPAPGIPAGADLEEDALSRFLAGERQLPMRPRRVERLWRLIHLAGDLIAAGAPADLAERCSAVLRDQPALAMTGLLDARLDAAACIAGLISTGLATARPVMMDDIRAAERLWHTAPAAAAVLCSRLLAGQAYLDEDPAAVVMEAALAQCGPNLDAPDHLEAAGPAAAVVPQPLLDASTIAAAAGQMSDARDTPELTRAAQDAPSVARSAERLVEASPYRRAAARITARRDLPAMSIALALVARISARGDEDCRSFERAWRPRWTDLARQAPRLTSIDLVLAETLIAAAERGFGHGRRPGR